MKRVLVLSLFYLNIVISFVFFSCDNNKPLETDMQSGNEKIDSIYNFYSIAKKDSEPGESRLIAIEKFINGVKELDNDSLTIRGLYYQARLLNKYFGPKRALEKSHELLEFAKEIEDSLYIGRALYRIGFYNNKLENYLESFKYYNEAFKVRRDLRDSISAGKTLTVMSDTQRILGDYNASKTTATDGLKYLENSTEYRNIAGLYHNIAIAFIELGNPNEALVWNNKLMTLTKDSIALKKIGINKIPIITNTRAYIFAKQEKYDESIAILKSLLDKGDELPEETNFSMVLSNLGYIKFLQNPDNEESEKLLLKALQIRQREDNIVGQFSSNIHLTKYYKDKDLEKARYHADQAYLNIKDFGDYEALLEVLTLITELKPDSLEDHQQFKETSLKLMELRKKTREIYAPTRFENENLLKETEEKEQQIIKVRNQNTIYLLGMMLLLTAIAFAVFFFRQRTKYLAQQNQMVQFQASYETETRISKRLHDDLGNDIFQVMLQYQNNPEDPKILSKLNTAYAKARDISRENNEFETDEEYPEELSNMLQNYTNNGIQLMARGLDTIDWTTFETPVKITVYRVLQELMTNMQKHSSASLVVLKFVNGNDSLDISYSDNGVGMAKDQLHSKNGLRNTEKRIQAIGGTLIFDSQKEKGFKANIRIPN
ncbi:hypothetical protein M0D21_01180 [Aquimarina sp. D1M17]|uniref:tetratricopeptide repeat-containing sensor histidine kinase n=1 Tax=Aquimarina acroporae TaxID=2937283 RepID=UPI0020BD9BCB|nr:ATP-binding protein [Aquimarina acroporae]MCK8520155.1 hypothetical protein [Aquimarina acroporae]